MNLAEAFSTLAKTGCRLRVEAEGGIILDVSPGCPPVPPSVLQVLAAHRESLAAVLAPAKPSPRKGDQTTPDGMKLSPGRRSPYAAENLANTAGTRRAQFLMDAELQELIGTDDDVEPCNAPAPKALPVKTDTATSMAQPVTYFWGSPVLTRAVAAPPATRPQLDMQAILMRARAKASKLRDRQQAEGQSPGWSPPGLPPTISVAGALGDTGDDIPF